MPNTKKTRRPSKRTRSLFWKILADFWGYVAITLFALDFVSKDHYRIESTGVTVIYLAILAIYASNKEYHRWSHIQ